MGWAGLAAGAASLGWAVTATLGDLAPVSPGVASCFAALAAVLWGRAVHATLGGSAAFLPCWLGLPAVFLPALHDRLAVRVADASFERVGLLWIGGTWRHADPATYLALLPAGALVALIAWWLVFRARRSPEAVTVLGVTALAVAALWRTMIHPPSGDEPSLLLAAWQWVVTGSADLTRAWDPAIADWSRASEFRDTLVRDHAIGAPGGPQYTYHGIVLPHAYGLLLWPAGRTGLALALVTLAAVTARAMVRAAGAVTGRPVSGDLHALILCGSPLAVYTVFTGPDLPAAACMTAGVLGLVTGRIAPVALAAAALPWVHQKCVFLSAGLVLGAWMISWRRAAVVLGAFLCSFVPEALWISGKIGVPVWPPTAIFTKHAQYGAAWSPLVWLQSAPGLLIDRYAGLIWYPAWVVGLAGCTAVVRRGTPAVRAAMVAGLPYLSALLTFSMWSGGNGAPARQLVPLLPVLVLGAAALDTRLTGVGRSCWRALCWISVAHALCLIFVPPVAFESAKLKIEGALEGRLGFDPLGILPAISKLAAGGMPGALTWIWVAVLSATGYAVYRGLARGRTSWG